MQDAVPVALEAGPPPIGLFCPSTVAGATGPGGPVGQLDFLELLALAPVEGAHGARPGTGVAVGMGEPGPVIGKSDHGGGPPAVPLGLALLLRVAMLFGLARPLPLVLPLVITQHGVQCDATV